MISQLFKVVILCLTCTSVLAQGKTHEHVLDNGLKLIVKEDHRAPVAVAQLWYRVGSSYEHSGITGVSHVLEHMMFKGTERYPSGRFSQIIAENGGRENAFTSRDYTGYFQLLDSSRIATSIELEADRMANLVLKEEDFLKELNVVKEERRLRTEDNPNALTYEQLHAAAYLNGPYHNPVVGWMQDLDSMKLDDLRVWYEQWYAPGNATLVIVGDVDPDEVLELVKKHYGAVKARSVAELKPRPEVTQRGERRVKIKAPAELPYMLMGYKVPSLATQPRDKDWESYALEVLTGILGGTSGRLRRSLVRGQEIAASAGVGYDPYARHQELFIFSGVPRADRDLADVEAALQREIDLLGKELVSSEELARVKAQVVANEVYELDSVMSQSYSIGILESVGLGWERANEYADQVKAVTPEQIREVVRKYLIDDRKTVSILEPQAIDVAAAATDEDKS